MISEAPPQLPAAEVVPETVPAAGEPVPIPTGVELETYEESMESTDEDKKKPSKIKIHKDKE